MTIHIPGTTISPTMPLKSPTTPATIPITTTVTSPSISPMPPIPTTAVAVSFVEGRVIQIDGGQHYTEEGLAYDKVRTAYLESEGLTVIRFTSHEVLTNIDRVVRGILELVSNRN